MVDQLVAGLAVLEMICVCWCLDAIPLRSFLLDFDNQSTFLLKPLNKILDGSQLRLLGHPEAGGPV
jgi:hypothetical protein